MPLTATNVGSTDRTSELNLYSVELNGNWSRVDIALPGRAPVVMSDVDVAVTDDGVAQLFELDHDEHGPITVAFPLDPRFDLNLFPSARIGGLAHVTVDGATHRCGVSLHP